MGFLSVLGQASMQQTPPQVFQKVRRVLFLLIQPGDQIGVAGQRQATEKGGPSVLTLRLTTGLTWPLVKNGLNTLVPGSN